MRVLDRGCRRNVSGVGTAVPVCISEDKKKKDSESGRAVDRGKSRSAIPRDLPFWRDPETAGSETRPAVRFFFLC